MDSKAYNIHHTIHHTMQPLEKNSLNRILFNFWSSQDIGELVTKYREEHKCDTWKEAVEGLIRQLLEEETNRTRETIVQKQADEEKTRICAKHHLTALRIDQCDACEHNHFCNFSTANKHYISHDAT